MVSSSNQFHDVLPGSSINEVYKDSAEHYADIEKTGLGLLKDAIAGLGGNELFLEFCNR